MRLNELVRGKRGATADTALRLAQLFKTTPQFWMHMQANVEPSNSSRACAVGHALHEEATIVDLEELAVDARGRWNAADESERNSDSTAP